MTAAAAKVSGLGEDGGDCRAGAGDEIIDKAHLGRATLGDCNLEREVLQIFVRQAALLLGRINGEEPAAAAAAAHTMIGSARGIGAWRVAHAAERLERAAREGGEASLEQALAELRSASLEVTAVIAARLHDGAAETANGRLAG